MVTQITTLLRRMGRKLLLYHFHLKKFMRVSLEECTVRENTSEEKRVSEDVTKANEFSKGKSGKNNENKKKVSSNEEGQNSNKGKGVEEKETSECKKKQVSFYAKRSEIKEA